MATDCKCGYLRWAGPIDSRESIDRSMGEPIAIREPIDRSMGGPITNTEDEKQFALVKSVNMEENIFLIT